MFDPGTLRRLERMNKESEKTRKRKNNEVKEYAKAMAKAYGNSESVKEHEKPEWKQT